jgi:predicted dehydrogenase
MLQSLIFCDTDAKRAQEIAGSDAKWCTDYRELFGKVDAVSIASPTSTHYKIARDFLNNGIDVLVEKPISETTDEALELDAIATKKKAILMVGHIFVYNQITHYIKELIDSGRLGDVYYLFGSFSGLKDLRNDSGTTHTYLVHHLAVANYLFGEPTKVAGARSMFLRKEFEDLTLAVLKYGKILAYFDASWLPPGKTRSLTIVGSKATIVADLLNQKIEIHNNRFEKGKAIQGPVEKPYVDMAALRWEEPLKSEFKHFLDCVKSRETPLTDGKSAVSVMRAVDRIIASKSF